MTTQGPRAIAARLTGRRRVAGGPAGELGRGRVRDAWLTVYLNTSGAPAAPGINAQTRKFQDALAAGNQRAGYRRRTETHVHIVRRDIFDAVAAIGPSVGGHVRDPPDHHAYHLLAGLPDTD